MEELDIAESIILKRIFKKWGVCLVCVCGCCVCVCVFVRVCVVGVCLCVVVVFVFLSVVCVCGWVIVESACLFCV